MSLGSRVLARVEMCLVPLEACGRGARRPARGPQDGPAHPLPSTTEGARPGPPGPGGGAGCHTPPRGLPAKPQQAGLILPLLRDERDRGGRDFAARGRAAQEKPEEQRPPGPPVPNTWPSPPLLIRLSPQVLQGRRPRTRYPFLTGDQMLGEEVTPAGWEVRGPLAGRQGRVPTRTSPAHTRPPGQTSPGLENRITAAHAVPRSHRWPSGLPPGRSEAQPPGSTWGWGLPRPSPGRPIWGGGSGLRVASPEPQIRGAGVRGGGLLCG